MLGERLGQMKIGNSKKERERARKINLADSDDEQMVVDLIDKLKTKSLEKRERFSRAKL